jgi:type I restriction enzyme S subunit
MCDGPFGSDMKSSHYADDGVRLVRLQNIGMGTFDDFDRAYISEEHFLSLPGHEVIPGDVLVAGLGDINHPVGRACLFPPELEQAMVKADCFRLRVKPSEVEPAFLVSFLCSTQARDGLTLATRGATRDRVNLTGIGQFAIPLPPLSEQRQIAQFLDIETSAIRTAVEKNERLIALLDEKRTALINRAVTKGLDPNAAMKDSGIPWLGSVPARWEVKRLKYAVPAITVGVVVTPAKYYADEGVPCLRSLNISGRAVDRSDLVFISPESNELLSKSKIRCGDVVVVRTGKTGAAAVVPEDLDGANCIDLLVIRRSPMLVSEYLWYLLNSRNAAAQIECFSEGAIQAHYNTSTLAELTVTVPPVEEQKAIVAWLDRKMAVLDAAIAKLRVQIAKFQEYRTALVSAAVTGKIDVRASAHV